MSQLFPQLQRLFYDFYDLYGDEQGFCPLEKCTKQWVQAGLMVVAILAGMNQDGICRRFELFLKKAEQEGNKVALEGEDEKSREVEIKMGKESV
jgi:hypothetical protein